MDHTALLTRWLDLTRRIDELQASATNLLADMKTAGLGGMVVGTGDTVLRHIGSALDAATLIASRANYEVTK